MFCVRCGKEIGEGTKFCPYCGSSVMGAPIVVKKNNGLKVAAICLAVVFLVIVTADLILLSRYEVVDIPFLDNIFSQKVDRYSTVYPNLKVQEGSIPVKIAHVEDSMFTEESRPYVQFNQDMTCTFHANLGMWETDIAGLYEVYLYNEGNRIISCTFEYDKLTEQGGNSYASNRVFFRELSNNEWEYCGELIGLTYNKTHLAAVDDSTIIVDECVLDENIYEEYIGYWQHYYDGASFPDVEVTITDVSNGRITFDIYIYRELSLSSETAVICPDGSAYGFISRDWENPQSYTTLAFENEVLYVTMQTPEWGSNAISGTFTLDVRSDHSAA